MSSCGKTLFLMQLSANSVEKLANLPIAKAADCCIELTVSERSGLRRNITPAALRASML